MRNFNQNPKKKTYIPQSVSLYVDTDWVDSLAVNHILLNVPLWMVLQWSLLYFGIMENQWTDSFLRRNCYFVLPDRNDPTIEITFMESEGTHLTWRLFQQFFRLFAAVYHYFDWPPSDTLNISYSKYNWKTEAIKTNVTRKRHAIFRLHDFFFLILPRNIENAFDR